MSPALQPLLAALPGTVIVDWDNARRAETYHATAIHTTTGVRLATKIASESDAVFTLTAGLPIKLIITARNDVGGKSLPSAPGLTTVP